MPDGGKLIIETTNLKLTNNDKTPIPSMKCGDYVMLAIHDSGTGISPDVKAHIFEPFFTTKERGKGTGLGLATVYAIVEQNNGYIECDSETGRGTSFKIYLPRLISPIAKAKTGHVASQMLGGNETILVVEDEEMVRNLACRVLRDAGYNILPAAGPMEAIQICEDYHDKIHLVLTDVIMPVMSGIALAEQLKAKYPKLKSIMMSGYMDSSFIENHVAASKDIIQKPFKKEALLSKIRESLDSEIMAAEGQPDPGINEANN
jgi:CheY-like chemotaxis protein